MSNFVNEFQANSVYTQTLTAQDSIETSLLTINGVDLEDKIVMAGTGLTKSGNVISINPNQTLASLTTTGIITVPFGENLRFQRWDGNSGNCMLGVLATSGGNDTTFIMRNQSYAGIIDFTTTHNLSKVVFNTPTVSVNGTTDATSPTTGCLRVLGGVGISKSLKLGADLGLGGLGEVRVDYPSISGGRLLLDNNGELTLGRGIMMILNTSDATSITTGALKVGGGIACSKSLQVGANLTVNGTSNLSNLIVTGTSNFTGLATFSGLNVTSSVNQPINLSMSTAATVGVTQFSNYLKPAMGANETTSIGFGQANSNRNMGYLGYTYVSSGSTNNCMTIGLYGVDKVLNIYGDGRVQATTTADSSAYNNDSLIVQGGAGIGKNLHVGGNLNVAGTFTASNLNVSSGSNTTDYVSFGGLTPTSITQKEIYFAKTGNIAHYSARIAYTASTGTWNGYIFIKTQHPAAFRDRWVKVVYQFYQYYYEAWGYVRNDDASKGLVMNVDPAAINALNPNAGEWLFSWNFQTV